MIFQQGGEDSQDSIVQGVVYTGPQEDQEEIRLEKQEEGGERSVLCSLLNHNLDSPLPSTVVRHRRAVEYWGRQTPISNQGSQCFWEKQDHRNQDYSAHDSQKPEYGAGVSRDELRLTASRGFRPEHRQVKDLYWVRRCWSD